ncbi:Gfo/Idh/MocA family oxidoreductase [Candidatus Woesearchaeota archaeon]|nr:Gfo/Idh/MocA family oxidoreductase [Candidatus Woesearchaeota archaeon]
MLKKLKSIKPLVIGLGLAGNRHLEAQLRLGIRAGVYDIDPKSTEHLKEKSEVIVFENLEDAINWSNLVHVCTPDDKHTEFVEKAIKKGKAVLCEKSFTTNLREALNLQKLAHRYDSTLVVGQNYRLTPTFSDTRRLVSKGMLGTITGIEATYLHDMAQYRLGTRCRNTQDFLYVGGSHAIDLAYWVMGEKVVSVQASTGKKIRSEYDCHERYQIILKFASGILCHISLDSSSAQPVNGSSLKIYGEKGQLATHNKIDKLMLFKKGMKKERFIHLPNSKTFTVALEVKIIDDYLLGRAQSHWPLPGVDDAVNVIRILDAISKAVSSGKREPVTY